MIASCLLGVQTTSFTVEIESCSSKSSCLPLLVISDKAAERRKEKTTQNGLEEDRKEVLAVKWLRLDFDWEFRGLMLLVLKSVWWDHNLPSGGLEASVHGNGSRSVLSPDLDSALSQKGRVLLTVPLLSHLC